MNSNLTRRNFLGASAVAAAGLGLVACGGSGSDAGSATTSDATSSIASEDLVKAAKEDGALVVYGSCEEAHVAACCENFQKLFGIETQYQRLSTGEVESKIEEENGNPSGDVWFGGTTDPYNVAVTKGLLEPYAANNASHLISDAYKDADGNWYGIYKGILGFFYNKDELERKGLDAPKDWPDLLDEKYKGLIWMSNYNTAGTAKLVLNTVIQKYGHDDGIKYLVDLDKNIQVYTKSGSGPSKNVGTGECTIGIGFLHDAIYQIVDNGYGNIGMVVPSSGASFEVGATAIFKGAKHENAAKLWVEYALSPECVERAQEVGAYQFLVIDNAKQPEVATEYGLDPDNVMKYDFADAKENTEAYVSDIMSALSSAGANTGDASRFQTE
ncbi:extracellular solute-binding protein family 1 [Olsenella uli DSM 7084]|uniref:Extracellular solute-binding protein family 1 n=1 Tax=Olsenella uli (strain ATCC 49627 / DSM 7084 / CCUG 31166 / CIP 109912 / JCM 12494 / LMG 11480 / NCIMB 702895 / VPI D76D-27C) TaxID=633147 RepID=E1QVX5_OLSUV|nr:extracellular solute-binding protein [Olsenella uli]ADK68278.1 extracellular solute-binding protein family 1 [Olsenella uli DSM 7084]